MSYDSWLSAEPDPGREVVERAPEPDHCRDCQQLIASGAHSTSSGTSCDPCWRWRQAHGCEFDARSIAQIEAAARKGAA